MTPTEIREIETLAAFANELADTAALQTMALFRSGLEAHDKGKKPNFDPVTAADRGAERAIRDHIAARYPDHTVCGEEFDDRIGTSPYKWLLDPIDGTKAFIVGIPVWATLIGLLRDGVPLLGVMDQPFVRERFTGTPFGTVADGPLGRRTLRTRTVPALSSAILASADPYNFTSAEDAERFHALRAKVRLTRFGGDAYFYCLLAAGQIDIVIDPGLDDYDVAALVPIIENAGGMITTWTGESPLKGGNIVATANATLHQTVLDVLVG
jgi:myo-inositol-1(or 4)-monophosphatase